MSDLADVQSESVAETMFDNLEIFHGMTSREVHQILRASEPQIYSAGMVLFEEGDTSDAMFLVETGELEVKVHQGVDDDIVLAHLGAGAVVGELSILEGNALRSATVRALSDVHAYRLSRESFLRLRELRSRAAYKLILNLAQILDERRRRVDERVNEVFEDPAAHIDEFESQVNDILARMHKV